MNGERGHTFESIVNLKLQFLGCQISFLINREVRRLKANRKKNKNYTC